MRHPWRSGNRPAAGCPGGGVMPDAPIDPQEFAAGLNVVDIGDLRIARGLSRRPYDSCRHLNLVYDSQERRIWCKDCEKNVEPFDAFKALSENIDGAVKRLQRREQEIKEAEAATARSRAVKALDEIWRTKNQAPCCPHCNEGLLPEDMLGRLPRVSRELTRAKRKR